MTPPRKILLAKGSVGNTKLRILQSNGWFMHCNRITIDLDEISEHDLSDLEGGEYYLILERIEPAKPRRGKI